MSTPRIEHVTDRWPEGISDGLNLRCGVCGQNTSFDYNVDSAAWQVVVPPSLRRGVVCLSCFDRLAAEKGVSTSDILREVQFTGFFETVLLVPAVAYRYMGYRTDAGTSGDQIPNEAEAPTC